MKKFFITLFCFFSIKAIALNVPLSTNFYNSKYTTVSLSAQALGITLPITINAGSNYLTTTPLINDGFSRFQLVVHCFVDVTFSANRLIIAAIPLDFNNKYLINNINSSDLTTTAAMTQAGGWAWIDNNSGVTSLTNTEPEFLFQAWFTNKTAVSTGGNFMQINKPGNGAGTTFGTVGFQFSHMKLMFLNTALTASEPNLHWYIDSITLYELPQW